MGGFFSANNYGSGFISPPSGAAPGPSLANIDPTVDSGTAAKAQLIFGFDKHFHSYTGNTVRLVRSSDSAESDFGCDASGRFDKVGVNSWRSGANVSVIKFYDQGGTAKELLAKSGGSASSLPVVVSNTWICAGTSFNTTTGALTLSSTDGAPMCEITGGKYLELTSSGLDMASGMGIHMLTATKLRKIEQNNTTDPLSNDSTAETYFSYGLSTTNNFRYELSGGNYLYALRRIATGAGGTDQALSAGGQLKANSVNIVSAVCDANIRLYARGKMPIDTATSAGNQTANASASNGTFRIGRRYPGSSGESTSAGNFYFSGVVITDSLTDFERFKLQARMEQVANQHLAYDLTVLDDMLGANGDLIDWRDADMTGGQITGKKGNVTFDINLATTIGGSTPNWVEDQASPYYGVTGLRSVDKTNPANAFIATTNYFMDVNTGTIGALSHRIDATNTPCQLIGSGSNTTLAGITASGSPPDWHLAIGWNHVQPDGYARVKESTDTTGKTVNGVGGGWGDQSLSQPSQKYLFNTPNGDIGTVESVAITGATKANPCVITATGHGVSAGSTNISGITKANPAVVTSTGHGLATGAKVWISGVSGMTEVNNAEYTVTVVNSSSFSLDGVNSTGYTTYTSGGTVKSSRVYISGVSGMTELNGNHYTITYINANSFSLNGVNSTGYGTYTSGGLMNYALKWPITGESQTWPVGTPITWANFLTDTGSMPATPEGRTYHNWAKGFHSYYDHFLFQCFTFEPGSYNPASPVVADMRSGTTKHFSTSAVGTGGLGHEDFSVANKDGFASVPHGNTSGRLQSMNFFEPFDGVRHLVWFSENAWTMEDARKFKTNIYKIYTEGWPA